MSHETPAPAADEPNDPNAGYNAYVNERQARVDRVVNDLGSRFNAAAGTPLRVDASTSSRPQMRYNTATDTFTYLDGGATVPASELERLAAEQEGEARIFDNGISIDFALGRLASERKRMVDRLAESSFDPATGARIYALQGAERRALETQLAGFDRTAADQVRDYARLQKQRDEDRAAAEQAAIDEAALEETIRREAQAKAFELEVLERAQAIIAEKKRRERNGG
jgi:hypothetical protein